MSVSDAILDAIHRLESGPSGDTYGIQGGYPDTREEARISLQNLIAQYGSLRDALFHYGEPCEGGATEQNPNGHLCGYGYADYILNAVGAGAGGFGGVSTGSQSQTPAKPFPSGLGTTLVYVVGGILLLVLGLTFLTTQPRVA